MIYSESFNPPKLGFQENKNYVQLLKYLAKTQYIVSKNTQI